MRQSQKLVTCKFCGIAELHWSWDFYERRPILINGGRKHDCRSSNEDMYAAKCRYCLAQDLLWIRRTGAHGKDKWELTESYGLPHMCEAFKVYGLAWREALREDYARAKKWAAAKPDGLCKTCKGRGFFLRTKKALWGDMIYAGKKCKRCRGIGNLNAGSKKNYLKELRKKYWPWGPHWRTNRGKPKRPAVVVAPPPTYAFPQLTGVSGNGNQGP